MKDKTVMNGYSRTLQCFYGAQFDPGADEDCWIAVKVYLDGNPIKLGHFQTEAEAEDRAGNQWLNDLAKHDVTMEETNG